ncbi:MAG: hypothetical protein G4V63_08720 [Candidatus Afipia apatlaquensis]|uniref:Uncharacterized protein n=1 Tax=Candidatus Afipia apatlaquensis TaxID=2712852 RepID=A0A7C9VLQ7_9BRAD|nr:hypothetical protein [Candidatus Afipia apatlaquensis]
MADPITAWNGIVAIEMYPALGNERWHGSLAGLKDVLRFGVMMRSCGGVARGAQGDQNE